tara:strand:- start:3845 stop:3988 length:144 start_codon:yes stop_codon:yes gene_type:complete
LQPARDIGHNQRGTCVLERLSLLLMVFFIAIFQLVKTCPDIFRMASR